MPQEDNPASVKGVAGWGSGRECVAPVMQHTRLRAKCDGAVCAHVTKPSSGNSTRRAFPEKAMRAARKVAETS